MRPFTPADLAGQTAEVRRKQTRMKRVSGGFYYIRRREEKNLLGETFEMPEAE